MISFRFTYLSTAIILIALACPVVGQVAAEKQSLTLEEAVNLAMERNPQILTARARTDVLEGQIKQVKSQAFPSINLNGTGVRWRDPAFLNSSSFDDIPAEFRDAMVPRGANLFDYNVNVAQPIYTAGKVGTALQLAKLEREGVGIDVTKIEQDIRVQVVRAFYGVLLSKKHLEIAQDTIKQRERHLDMARTRFRGGVATEVDVLRSEVSVANARPEVLRAENGVRYARSLLNNLMARPTDFPTDVVGELIYIDAEKSGIQEVVEKAYSGRAELQRLRLNEKEAEAQRKLANAESRMRVDLNARYGFSSRLTSNLVDPTFTSWMFTLNFQLPLFDGGRRAGLVEQAIAGERIARLTRSQVQDAISLEAQTAIDELHRADQTVQAARASVKEAERVLTMMEQNYNYGAATTLDVQDSQTAVSVARLNLYQSLHDHTVARAQLRYVMGDDPLESNHAQNKINP